jgi:N-methylhydantoinase B/oxoprolinase/acetone carboxylase alpha subunit
MAAIDKLSRPMRELVDEFGAAIVLGMIADGHRDARKLRIELEAWRERRQNEWLATDYVRKAPKLFDGPEAIFNLPSHHGMPIRQTDELSLTELFPDI